MTRVIKVYFSLLFVLTVLFIIYVERPRSPVLEVREYQVDLMVERSRPAAGCACVSHFLPLSKLSSVPFNL